MDPLGTEMETEAPPPDRNVITARITTRLPLLIDAFKASVAPATAPDNTPRPMPDANGAKSKPVPVIMDETIRDDFIDAAEKFLGDPSSLAARRDLSNSLSDITHFIKYRVEPDEVTTALAVISNSLDKLTQMDNFPSVSSARQPE